MLANQLYSTGIYSRDVRNRAFWRVFHRHTAQAAQERGQARFQLFPTCINGLRSRQIVEVMTLDRVDQGPRLSRGGNQIEPPACGHPPFAERVGDTRCDGVRSVKIVKQPAVKAFRSQCFLNCRHVQRHPVSIANA